MKILAVAMLDVETFGMDAFFVQISATEVIHFEVHSDGRIRAEPPEPKAIADVTMSVEKFNHGYLVEEPVSIDALSELPSYLGRFEITSDTRCRLRGSATGS